MQKTVLALCLSFTMLTACSKPNENNPPPDHNVTASMDDSASATVMDTPDTANALDWVGTYQGVLPCHDCSGIDTELELTLDHHFVLKQKFLGKSNNNYVNEVKGSFQFLNGSDQLIQLDSSGDSRIYYIGAQFIEMRGDKGQVLDQPEFNFKLTKFLE